MKTFTTLTLCSFLTIFTLQAQPQILDSMTVRTFSADTELWTDTDKEEYTYDYNGNLILFINHDWDEDIQELLPSIKEEYSYDEWDETLYLLSNWDDTTQQWIYEKKTERAHDTNGNRTLFACYNWDVNTAQWVGINIKSEDTYDENNNLIIAIKYNWDMDAGQWIGNKKEEYTYSDSLLTLEITYNWNTDTQQWIAYSKNEYSYDDENREILKIEYRWNNSSQEWKNRLKIESEYTNNTATLSTYSWNYYDEWEFTGKTERTYDAGGRLINQTHYDCWGTPCLPIFRSVWAYDADGNLLSRLEQEGQGLSGTWLTNERITYTYDSNGNLLSETYEYIYWDNYSRSEYEYDINNNLIEHRFYEKDYEFSSWIPEYRTQWAYNSDNQIISIIHSNWNTTTQAWQYAWKSDYTYDNANYIISTIRSNWNEDTQEWEYTWKSTHTYDYAYTYADLILPPFDKYAENYFPGKRTNYTRYIWENGEWVYDYERTYYYSELDLPIENAAPLRAYVQENTIILTWATATEINNAGFDIQKSKNGINWQKIAWQNGQGNSTTQHEYRHVDTSPFIGINYYRLKQVDFDGTFSYSSIASARYMNGSLTIHPNPTRGIININVLNDETIDDITLFDVAGKQVYHSMSGNTLDVATLPQGMYWMKIEIGTDIFYEKIMVK